MRLTGVAAPRSSRISLKRAVRVTLLIFGLVLTTVAMVELIDAKLALHHVAPWSYLGLIGLAAVIAALGSPRSRRVGND